MKDGLMQVAFNATALLSPLTGIGQYAHHLALGLQQVGDVNANFFYGSGWNAEVRTKPLPSVTTIKTLVHWLLPNSYGVARTLQQRQFSKGTQRTRYDIYHEPNFLAYRFDGPSAITVHDLSWIRFPEMHPVERVRAMDKYFQPGLERASLILTDSEFVKRELIDVFGVKPERIHPVLLGVEALFHPRSADETRAVLDAHGLVHGQFILAVGTLEPRKNLAVALRAFMQLPPPLRKRFPLVLVGMKGWRTSALEQQIAPLVAAGEIRQLGYLPRQDLATIIAGATTLIYPSIYEGFGLPPLEAMACGVPVITSNVSSIPEVVGDTGLMLDPQDVDGFAKGMEALLAAPDVRDAMARKALARSTQFTWASCVSQTVEAYRLVLNKS
ncbi:glycosyltransferase family 4 protein [Polaromonas sp. JS666]|uniref:glycosyltransferase family 4 protein n=1 Tax=Polaromonas sp. (strain JS666 / ATCC BAA-500) TaxID=296591 RepID=UPI000053302D|nr:glycosyltransferase family 1 protein [Polaromonas sp. JS666]ABE45909.1 glycosyl transferase, group 1 [Polaromonas sp. JS666]